MTEFVAAADKLSWSRSQISALRECRRKYYFNVKSAAGTHPLLLQSARLKKLVNRFLWTGGLVHGAIGSLLKILRQGMEPPPIEETLARIREEMRSQFKISKESVSLLKAGLPALRLFEHEYGFEIPPEEWRRQWDLVETSLRWFAGSQWFARLKSLGPECWKAVDEILSFDVNGIKAFCKIDCAIETGGRFILMDWKTTPSALGSNPALQIAALYAHDVWGAAPESIEAMSVCLRDGTTARVRVDEETLMEAQVGIEEEAIELQEFLASVNGDPLSVSGISNPVICDRCSYKKICYPLP